MRWKAPPSIGNKILSTFSIDKLRHEAMLLAFTNIIIMFSITYMENVFSLILIRFYEFFYVTNLSAMRCKALRSIGKLKYALLLK